MKIKLVIVRSKNTDYTYQKLKIILIIPQTYDHIDKPLTFKYATPLCQLQMVLMWRSLILKEVFEIVKLKIEQHVLDTNAGKQLS